MFHKQKNIYMALLAVPLLTEALFLSGTASAGSRSEGFAIQDDYEWQQYRQTFDSGEEKQSDMTKLPPKDASREDVQKYIKDSLNSNNGMSQNIKINGRKKNDDGSYRVAITYYGADNQQKNLVVEMDNSGSVYDADTSMSDQELQAAYDEIMYGGKNEMNVFDVITVNDILHSKSREFMQNVADNLGIDTDTASKAAAGAMSLAGVVIIGAGASQKEKKGIFETVQSAYKRKKWAGTGNTGKYAGSTIDGDIEAQHLWDIALKASDRSSMKLDPRLLWAQMMHESGRGHYEPAIANNNWAGLHGGSEGQYYADDDEYIADYIDNFLNWRFEGMNPTTATEFATRLKETGYFTGDVSEYISDMNDLISGLNIHMANQQVQSDKLQSSSLVDKAFEKADGRTSPYGSVGCAETVTYAGAYYNKDLQEEFINGVVSVPMLRADLENKGYVCTSFDGYANKGDLLIYGDDDHVVIADGAGGCFGNSSSLGYAKHYSDANYAWGNGESPTKIIKMI